MTFASAAFLAGFALLAIPWWLHRLNAHAAEQHTFASLFLMRPSEAPVNMRRKLQHLILLAIRWLFLIAACLAFAEPFIELSGDPVAADEPATHHIIVVDTSLSMNRDANGEQSLDRARRVARDIITGLSGDTRVAIVSAGDQLQLLVPPTQDRSRLNAAISGIEAGSGRLVLGGLLGRVNTLGETLIRPGERLAIHLLSDFQQTALPEQFTRMVSGSVWPLSLHPLADAPAANFSITNLRLSESATGAEQLAVTVQGFNTGAEILEIELAQNAIPIGTARPRVTANSSVTALFDLPEARRGSVTWTAEIRNSDALAADNVRSLVRVNAESVLLPVLSFDDHGFAYLNAAVRAAAPRFQPEIVTSLGATAAPVVIAVDPGTLPGGQDRELIRYLEGGGAVLITAGIKTRSGGRIPVIDASLAPARFDQVERGAVTTDRTHPALAGFGNWQNLKFFQTLKLDQLPEGEVILALDDGSPLLIEYRVGTGKLMVLTTALDPGWTSLVVSPAFVTFTANLLGYLAEDLLPVEALVGQPFAIPAQSVQLFDQTGDRVLGLAETVGRPTVSLAAPGVYQLRTPASTRLLAVNTDLRESDLTPAGPAYLARWQTILEKTSTPIVSNQNQPQDPAQAAADEAQDATRAVPLATWLLILLVLLVLIEPLLANTGLIRNRTEGALST